MSCAKGSSPTYPVDLTGEVVAAVAFLVPQFLAMIVALVLMGLAEGTNGHCRFHLGAGETSSDLGDTNGSGGGPVRGQNR